MTDEQIDTLADTIEACFNNGEEGNLTDAMERVAYQLQYLGNGNATTQMGAIENLSVQIKDGAEAIATSIHDLAQAIRERD